VGCGGSQRSDVGRRENRLGPGWCGQRRSAVEEEELPLVPCLLRSGGRGRRGRCLYSDGNVQAGDDVAGLGEEDAMRHGGKVDANPGAMLGVVAEFATVSLGDVDVAVSTKGLEQAVVKVAASHHAPRNGLGGGVGDNVLDQRCMGDGGAPEVLGEA
jgi:hypothetical protein